MSDKSYKFMPLWGILAALFGLLALVEGGAVLRLSGQIAALGETVALQPVEGVDPLGPDQASTCRVEEDRYPSERVQRCGEERAAQRTHNKMFNFSGHLSSPDVVSDSR